MRNYIVDVLLVLCLLVLAGTIVNPYYMPMGMQLTVLVAVVVLFSVFATLLWRENGGDEREVFIRYQTDRLAFLAGATALIIALVVETMKTHMVHTGVVFALVLMVLAKIAAGIYYNR